MGLGTPELQRQEGPPVGSHLLEFHLQIQRAPQNCSYEKQTQPAPGGLVLIFLKTARTPQGAGSHPPGWLWRSGPTRKAILNAPQNQD